jgi:hypothetical protein
MVPSRDKNEKIETQNKYIITSKSLSIWSSVVSTSKYLVIDQWFSPGTPVSSFDKTYLHDITEIILESTIKCHKPNLTPR